MKPLTPTERLCVLAAARGLTAQQTARRYGYSLHGVNWALGRAKTKLGAVTIAHAVALALCAGEFATRDVCEGCG